MTTPIETTDADAALWTTDAPARELVASGVSAWFGSHKVLDRVSLVMEANRVTALIGPSGCGKSTFLRILNRMHELVPSAALSGSVYLDGVDIYGEGERPIEVRKRVGMVFQKPNPFPAMSIYQNVISGLSLSGKRVRERRRIGRAVPDPGRPLERGQEPARDTGWRALRWPAAAAVHRPGDGGASRRCC